MTERLQCFKCQATFDAMKIRYFCTCGGMLTVERDLSWSKRLTKDAVARRRANPLGIDGSGVWRFREGVLGALDQEIVTHPEGGTKLYRRSALSELVGLEELYFKHEGENPTGSFKDRGMTVAITQAKRLGCTAAACASTGNTSASLAAYAAQAGLKSIVFLPVGKVATGKLAQTLAYGAKCLAIRGDFDQALELAQAASEKLGIYLVNSLNPFRLEGQKTIIWELLQDLQWQVPDWIVVPGGNLGNVSAFGKALAEAKAAGWIQTLPRLAVIQAHGASPFFKSFKDEFRKRHKMKAETIATAIRIGDPVNYEKARAAIELTQGLVDTVNDQEIIKAKSEIDGCGIGCEPASACTLAGVKKLVASGVMRKSEKVVCILTGNILKDPDVVLSPEFGAENLARIIEVDATIAGVERALRG